MSSSGSFAAKSAPDEAGVPASAALVARLAAWRVPLTIIALCLLPWLLPSKALAVNVLIYGLFAVGYNLLFGYTGLLSFGHAAFFGAGAYVTGIAIGQFGADWFTGIVCGMIAASVLALAIGILSIRTRGIYFAMVTLALAQLIYYIALQASSWTGGENGLRGFTVTSVGIGPLALDLLDPVVKYYVVLAFVALALWFLSRVLASPFGGVIEAIRENEGRARACGYNIARTRLLAFVLSGMLCGLAGTLSALHLSIVPLEILGIATSGQVVMMTLLGGAGTFFGPFIGAFAYLVMEDVLTLWTPHWQLALGAVFVVFVLYLPKGIWGGVLALVEGRAQR